jgi:hypothetical protein
MSPHCVGSIDRYGRIQSSVANTSLLCLPPVLSSGLRYFRESDGASSNRAGRNKGTALVLTLSVPVPVVMDRVFLYLTAAFNMTCE